MLHMKYAKSLRYPEYSALSVLILGLNKANGQITYHDVEPDYHGTHNNAPYELDLNNDGIYDLKLNEDFYSTYHYIETSMGKSVHTFKSYQLTAYGINGAKLLGADSIYVLENVDTIGQSGPWENFSKMAFFSNRLSFLSVNSSVFYNIQEHFSSGNWLNMEDKFIGIKVEEGGLLHFGWIRLDVNGNSFTVKDYAINEIPDQMIKAGEFDCQSFSVQTDALTTLSCWGDPIELYAVTPTTFNKSYQWFKDQAILPGETASTYTAVEGGMYQFSVQYNDLCMDTSQSTGVIFAPLLLPTISISNDTLFSNYQFHNHWYHYNVYIPGATGNYYVPQESGIYQLRVDTFTCFAWSEDFDYEISGIVTNSPQPFAIQWNDDVMVIKLTESHIEVQDVFLINDLGQIVHAAEFSNDKLTIDMSNYPAGIYALVIQEGKNRRVFRFPFIR
jgi:hypothetical protein